SVPRSPYTTLFRSWTKQRRRGWRSAPVFASAHRGAPRKPAKRKRARGQVFLPAAFLAARAARALAAFAFLAALAALILAESGWGASGVRRNSRLPMAGRSAKRV